MCVGGGGRVKLGDDELLETCGEEVGIKLDYVAIGKFGRLTSKDQPLPSPEGDAAAAFALWSPRTTSVAAAAAAGGS